MKKTSSRIQEEHIAKVLGGSVQPNSGGTKFGGGDVHTESFLIEAKTSESPKTSVSVKKEWITKSKEQAFEQSKIYSALSIRFEPQGEDYYIIDEGLMKLLVRHLDSED